MHRFINHIARHLELPEDAQSYLAAHGRIIRYKKRENIKLPDYPFPYFCVVLEGLVGGYQTSRSGRIMLRELIQPTDFFTGTEHLFTQRDHPIEYLALLPTEILCIPLAEARFGQLQYPSIAEAFQIMKQRKINTFRKLINIYREMDFYDRYCEYRTLLPTYTLTIPHHVQQELLGMSETTYYRVKRRYLRTS